jgi:tetratricopeptide (TPR) repeat protein
MPDYYQILEVPKDASQAQIRSAYKKLALKYHPDRNPNNPAAEDYFKRVNEAYHTLSDSNKKYYYDYSLSKPIVHPPYSPPTPTYAPYQNSYDPKNFVSKKMQKRIKILAVIFMLLISIAGFWGHWYMNKRNARIYYKQALDLYNQKEYRYANIRIGSALSYDEHYYDAYLLRAKINSEQFYNFFRAIEDYEWVMKHKKEDSAELLFRRGWCYFRMYDFEQALKDFEQALKLDADNPKYLFYKSAMNVKLRIKDEKMCDNFEMGLKLQVPEASEFLNMYCSNRKMTQNQ